MVLIMKKLLYLFTLFFLGSVVVRCQTTQEENISCNEANELIQKHKNDINDIVLDLRTKEMFDEGHLEGAIYYDVYSEGFNEWIQTFDTTKTYLLYCNAGFRSAEA